MSAAYPYNEEDLFKDTTMTFGEHLAELRQCLIRALVGLVLVFILVLAVNLPSQIIRFVNRPLEGVLVDYYQRRAVQWVGDQLAELRKLGFSLGAEPTLYDAVRQDRLVPQLRFVSLEHLQQAVAQIYPERFSQQPPLLSARDLLDAQRLCRTLVDEHTQGPEATKHLWNLLPSEARRLVQQVAQSSTPPEPKQLAQLAQHLAELIRRPEPLLSRKHYEEFLGIRLQLVALTAEEQLRQARAQRFQELEPLLESLPKEQQNRLLLAALFPDMIAAGPRRANMVPVVLWVPLEQDPRVSIKSLGPYETFMIWLKAAVVAALVIASPWVFYQLWIFVAAGLYPHEKRYVYIFLPISLGLFLGGVALCFFYVLPIVLEFLFVFNRWAGVDPDMRLSDWFGFALLLPVAFGASFQLPLVMLFLERIGIFTIESYLSQWRMAVLVIFVLSMLLTPADPGSMLLMAIPLTGLYFGGILMCRWMPRTRNPYGEVPED